MKRSLQIILLTLFFTHNSNAADVCQYFISAPIDDGNCKMPGTNTMTGGGYPTYLDASILNPASIPIIKTPVGFEAMLNQEKENISHVKKGSQSFSLIKGFDNAGVGLSSSSDDSFFTNNIKQAFETGSSLQQKEEFEKYISNRPKYSFGGALTFPFKLLEQFSKPTIGYSFNYNRTTKRVDYSMGASINSRFISFGYSTLVEKSSGLYIGSKTYVMNLGFKIPYLRAELSREMYRSSYVNLYTDIATITLKYRAFLGTYGVKSFKNLLGDTVKRDYFSAQFRLSKKVVMGAMVNYIPDAISLVAQIFF